MIWLYIQLTFVNNKYVPNLYGNLYYVDNAEIKSIQKSNKQLSNCYCLGNYRRVMNQLIVKRKLDSKACIFTLKFKGQTKNSISVNRQYKTRKPQVV